MAEKNQKTEYWLFFFLICWNVSFEHFWMKLTFQRLISCSKSTSIWEKRFFKKVIWKSNEAIQSRLVQSNCYFDFCNVCFLKYFYSPIWPKLPIKTKKPYYLSNSVWKFHLITCSRCFIQLQVDLIRRCFSMLWLFYREFRRHY